MNLGLALASCPLESLSEANAELSDRTGASAAPTDIACRRARRSTFIIPLVSISVGPRKLQLLGVSSYPGFSVKPSPARIMRTKTVPVTYPRPQTGWNSADGGAARISATEEPAEIRR